jgi:hypothetical protein
MDYVVAGYVIVLTTLFCYGVQLVWRRRRLTRTVARVLAQAEDPYDTGDHAGRQRPLIPGEGLASGGVER